MFTFTAVSQFLRRIFRIKSRETDDDLYHGHFLHKATESLLITDEEASQMGLYFGLKACILSVFFGLKYFEIS